MSVLLPLSRMPSTMTSGPWSRPVALIECAPRSTIDGAVPGRPLAPTTVAPGTLSAIDASALDGFTDEILLGVERRDGERRLLLLRRAGHAGDDDFLKAVDVALQLEVVGLRACAEDHFLRCAR